MPDPAVRVATRPDGVAVLTFDQPGSKANVLSEQMWADFGAALDGLTDAAGLVLASAKPGIFIAGADLKLLADAPAPNDPAVRAFIESGLRVLDKLEGFPFPTCAAIDGAALGGGLEVALACDFRVCGTHPKVQLGLPETKLGLIPGWGGTQRLPRIVGLPTAAEMLVSGRPLDADEARASGLVDDTAADPLEAAVGQLSAGDWRARRDVKRNPIPEAHRVGYRPPVPGEDAAARTALQVMTRGAVVGLGQAIPLETEGFQTLAGSDESKQRITDFFAARKKPG